MEAKQVKSGEGLTAKQQRFVEEYLVDLNATQAAIRAGYSVKGAESQGSSLLIIPKVSREIAERIGARAKRVEVTQDRVVEELSYIAFANPRNIFAWGPSGVTLKDSGELTDADARAVSEVSETVTKDGGTVRCKLHDKVKALELLGKHLGMFAENKQRDTSDWSEAARAWKQAMENS